MNSHENYEGREVDCGNCHAANARGSKFCGSCGTALRHTEVSALAEGDAPTKKSSPAITIIAAIGALAIGVGGFVFFMGQTAAPTTDLPDDNPWPDIDVSSIRTTLNEQSGSLWILDTNASPVGTELALLRTSPSADCSLLVFADSESAVETIDVHFPDFIFGESVIVSEMIDTGLVVALFENTSNHQCYFRSIDALDMPAPTGQTESDLLEQQINELGAGAAGLYEQFNYEGIGWRADPFADFTTGSILTLFNEDTPDGSECSIWVFRSQADLEFALGEGLLDFLEADGTYGQDILSGLSVFLSHPGKDTDCYIDAANKLFW